MNSVHPRQVLFAIIIVFLAIPLYQPVVQAESDPFPVYSSIKPNVAFWIKIFTQYSSKQAVIHDNREINRIYDIIELVDSDLPGNKRINREKIKKSKKRYKAIVEKLMRGKTPDGSEEQHVAKLFGRNSSPKDFEMAVENIRCQVGLKDRFRAGIIRSGAYIDAFKQIFRNEGLPEDLAYLPHVESSFNPRAYSKSGAVGTWQFTRGTGKLFMKVDDVIDERWDPMRSAHAAAKLLCENYLKLEEWPMAITAYNHGAYGMARAKRSHGSYETIFENFQSRRFRFASRNFYSEFLAARETAKNYHQYFGKLTLDTPRNNPQIIMPGYVSLPELAQHLKLNLADLDELNPALKSPVLRGQKYVPKGYTLQLPGGSKENWQAIFTGLPQNFYHPKQRRSRFHIVRKGDTAGKIARKHGVKLNDLIAANTLNRRAKIYINQKIKIPLSAGNTF